MILSANEVRDAGLKAARGGGLALGLAQCFADALVWAAAAGRDCAPLIEAVGADGAQNEAPARLPSVLDHLVETGEARTDAPGPLVVAYAGAHSAAWGVTLRLFGPAEMIVRPEGATGAPPFGTITLTRTTVQTAPLATTGPVVLEAAEFQKLTALAARIYVPETNASRLTGAGAGLTDND